jgi:hypothetical protein
MVATLHVNDVVNEVLSEVCRRRDKQSSAERREYGQADGRKGSKRLLTLQAATTTRRRRR